MANLRRRGSSLFPGLLLLFVGLLLLRHNYWGRGIVDVLGHWWPLILIFWGAVKLYERMAASRSGDPGAAKITAGEVFLVLGLLSLLGIVVAAEYFRENIPGHFREWGNSFDFDLEVAPKSVPADARITIRNGRGNISVRPSDEAQIRVSGKKKAKAWSENDAQKVAKGVRFISQRTDLTLSQLAGHMEASPGNLEIFDAPGNLSLRSQDDITLENAGGKVKVDNRRGNVEVRFSVPPKDDIEINNSSAGITLSLPESSSFAIVADCHSGDIDSEFQSDSLKLISGTGSGDSHLEGKYGSGRGPKITLKTSYGSISLHRTSSDIPAPPKPPRVKAPPAPEKPEEN